MFKKLLIPLCCCLLLFTGCNAKPDPWKEARKTYKRLDPWESYQTLIELLQKENKEQARYLVTNMLFRFVNSSLNSLIVENPLKMEKLGTLKEWSDSKNDWIPLTKLELKKIDWDISKKLGLKEKVVLMSFICTYADGIEKEQQRVMTKINGFWQRGLSPTNALYPQLVEMERVDEEIVW